jgi:hypothetical protein
VQYNIINNILLGRKSPEVLDLLLAHLLPVNDLKCYLAYEQRVKVSTKFASLLLHENLAEINLDILKDKTDVTKIYPILARKCPNLKKIALSRSMLVGDKCIPVQQLANLTELEELIMPGHLCDDSDMRMIANTFPKLK